MQIAALALAALATAGAAPPSPPDLPPAVLSDYGHPDAAPDSCQVKSPNLTVCRLPPKTAGRYQIVVQGKSSATSPDAIQAIAITGQGWACGEAASKKGDWSGERTFAAQCIVTVLSDAPLEIAASFGGPSTKPDAKGPVVAIRKLPWAGVIQTVGFGGAVIAPSGGASPGPTK